MSIYRGAGGSGDAVADSASEALLIRATGCRGSSRR
jgi:hypothetical protein